MLGDRRSNPRFPCLLVGEARLPGVAPFEVVCTSICRGGGFFTCRSLVQPGTPMTIVFRPAGTDGHLVECAAEAMWLSAKGSLTPPGFGARFRTIRCSKGDDALRSFAAEHLRWADLPPLPADAEGRAWLRLTPEGRMSGGFAAQTGESARTSGAVAPLPDPQPRAVADPEPPVVAPADPAMPLPVTSRRVWTGAELPQARTVVHPQPPVAPTHADPAQPSPRPVAVAAPAAPTAPAPAAPSRAPVALGAAAPVSPPQDAAPPQIARPGLGAPFGARPRMTSSGPHVPPVPAEVPDAPIGRSAAAAVPPPAVPAAPVRPPAREPGSAPSARVAAPGAIPIATTALEPSADLQARLAALFSGQEENGPTVMLDPRVVDDLVAAARTTAPPPRAAEELPADAVVSGAQDTGQWSAPGVVTDPEIVAAPALPAVGEDPLAELLSALGGPTQSQAHGPITNPGWGAPSHEDAGFGSTWGPPTPKTAALLQGVLDLPEEATVHYGRRGDELVAPGPLAAGAADPEQVVNSTVNYGPAAATTAQSATVLPSDLPSEDSQMPGLAHGARESGDAPRRATPTPTGARARAKATAVTASTTSPRSGPTEPSLQAQTVPGFDPVAPVAAAATAKPPTAPSSENTVAYKRNEKPPVPPPVLEEEPVGRPTTAPGYGESTVTLKPGTVQPVLDHWPQGVPRSIANRYDQLQRIGQGGHGVVFRAVDKMLDRYVVLKFLLQSTLSTEMARKYFMREVKLSASLNHPNIVHIYDIGNTDGVLWYAMEFVDGVTLAQYLPNGKPLDDLGFLYSAFSQLCEALDHAHGQGILHRDVKPDNALVASDGSVKLFDFGLARIADQGFGDQSLLLGTPFFMAPEQLTGGKVDHRADVYALGVLLYRMLAGELPFRDGNIFAAHVLEPVPDPRRYNPHLPEPVVQLLMRMLAKSADGRPSHCRPIAVELWTALFGGN